MNKIKYLLKNMKILTISNFSSRLLTFFLVPLYTSVLSTSEYGIFDLTLSTITLFYPIFTLNITDAIMRFILEKDSNPKKIVVIGIKYIVISIILFSFGMYVLDISNILPDINGLEIYILLYYIFYVLNQFLVQLSKGLERVKELGISGVVGTLVALLANLLFLLYFKWGISGFFIANIFSLVISDFYLIRKTRVLSLFDFKQRDKKLHKEMLFYSIPLITTSLGWWVNSSADKYVVSFLMGVASSGVLSVSYKIPQILNTFQGIFTQAWQISAIKEYGEDDTAKFYGNTFTVTNLLMCAVCSWLIILTRPLARILYANDFYPAWQYVPFLLISSVLNCASGLLGPILSAQKNSKEMMYSAIIGSVANIIMNVMLVSYVGIQGATIATVICSYLIYIVRKLAVGQDIKIDKYGRILFTWLMLLIQAIVEIYLNKYIIEIMIMILLVGINFKSLKQLLLTRFKTLGKERLIN